MTQPPSKSAVALPTSLGRAMGEVGSYREHNPGFGAYLCKLREDRGQSPRDAADHRDMTFAKRQRRETAGRSRIDGRTLFADIADIADAYVRPTSAEETAPDPQRTKGRTPAWPKFCPVGRIMEAAGVEPASETTQRRRLRA
ncbi:MAG: hypothetical protein RLZZ383_1466 [Pseudomonadota bacterium]